LAGAEALEPVHFGWGYYAGNYWGYGMNTEDTKLQGAETDLKQLMADVTRAMEKAQQAIARVTSKEAAASPETDATPPSA
jgi:hypothetical protein